MRIVRGSSLEEYASWYLEREARKGDSRAIPADPSHKVQLMRERHAGKMRDWFDAITRWHLVEVEGAEEISNLVFLESSWTKEEGLVIPEGPNYRLLGRVAAKAMACGYLTRPSAQKHKDYYDRIAAGTLQLRGADRIAVCSAEAGEIAANPAARYYLLDGVGRCLPYMILLKEQKLQHTPIEALLAEREGVRFVGPTSGCTRRSANILKVARFAGRRH